MELPDELLTLVRDFSRPVTRPDWRDLHRMTSYRLHCGILLRYNERRNPVIYTFVKNYDIEPKDKFVYRFIYGAGYLEVNSR